jgi:hypothetical protein
LQYITFVSPFQSGDVVDIILQPNEKGRCVGLFGALLREGRTRNCEAPRRVREGLFVCFGSANMNSWYLFKNSFVFLWRFYA